MNNSRKVDSGQRPAAAVLARSPSARQASPSPTAASDSLQRSLAEPAAASPDQIRALQRAGGNRVVARLLAGSAGSPSKRPAIQTRLTVGAAGDQYEQEADRVAGAVMRMTEAPAPPPAQPDEAEGLAQRKPLTEEITPLVQRSAREDDPEIVAQRRAAQAVGGFLAGQEVESRLASNQGHGSPLSSSTRSFMEERFGADFGGVRVHTGGESTQLNRKLSAQAFTHGPDIYFGSGKYSPGTSAGKQLLAHELTHVVQQQGRNRSGSCVIQAKWETTTMWPGAEQWDKVIHGIRWLRNKAGEDYHYLVFHDTPDVAYEYYGDDIIYVPDQFKTFEQILEEINSSDGKLKQPLALPSETTEESQPTTTEPETKKQESFSASEYVYEHDVPFREQVFQVCQQNDLQGICTAWTVDWIKRRLGGEDATKQYGLDALNELVKKQKEYLKVASLETFGKGKGLDMTPVANGQISYWGGCKKIEQAPVEENTAYYLELQADLIGGGISPGHALALYKDAGGLTCFDQNFGLLKVTDMARFNEAYEDEIQLLHDKVELQLRTWKLYKIKPLAVTGSMPAPRSTTTTTTRGLVTAPSSKPQSPHEPPTPSTATTPRTAPPPKERNWIAKYGPTLNKGTSLQFLVEAKTISKVRLEKFSLAGKAELASTMNVNLAELNTRIQALH